MLQQLQNWQDTWLSHLIVRFFSEERCLNRCVIWISSMLTIRPPILHAVSAGSLCAQQERNAPLSVQARESISASILHLQSDRKYHRNVITTSSCMSAWASLASGPDNSIFTSVAEVYGVWNLATNYHGASCLFYTTALSCRHRFKLNLQVV